jgi:hypothetical protein
MVTTRLLRVRIAEHMDRLAAHIHSEQAEGRSVLLVTAHHPAGVLLRHFSKAGINLARIFILDAVGMRAGVERPEDPHHLMYLPGPTQLELIAMRAERAVAQKAEGPATVIVSTINAFALYNSFEALEEIIRYVVFMLAGPNCRIDFILEDEVPAEPQLVAFLQELAGKQGELGQPRSPGEN